MMTLTVDAPKGVSFQQRGGSVTLPPTILPENQNLPTTWESVLDWESTVPMDVQLQLQCDYATDPNPGGFFAARAFPPRGACSSWVAGAAGGDPLSTWIGDTSGGLGPAQESCMVVRIECGGGHERRHVYADARSGRYSLGSQRYVRVDVCRWARDGLGEVLVQGSVGPSQSGPDPLTYSAQRWFEPSGEEPITIAPAYLLVPPGAAWFDVYPALPGDAGLWGGQLTIYAHNTASFRKPDASGLVYPPCTPWPVPPGSRFLTVEPSGTEGLLVGVTFWVR